MVKQEQSWVVLVELAPGAELANEVIARAVVQAGSHVLGIARSTP
ncbi:MAG TPA: hypothetical protein VMT18_12930 [Planctomycetota bacterium]|nr:hypothetical protein [Planctomycetota bacterium]